MGPVIVGFEAGRGGDEVDPITYFESLLSDQARAKDWYDQYEG